MYTHIYIYIYTHVLDSRAQEAEKEGPNFYKELIVEVKEECEKFGQASPLGGARRVYRSLNHAFQNLILQKTIQHPVSLFLLYLCIVSFQHIFGQAAPSAREAKAVRERSESLSLVASDRPDMNKTRSSFGVQDDLTSNL